jgi:hypothetical protein
MTINIYFLLFHILIIKKKLPSGAEKFIHTKHDIYYIEIMHFKVFFNAYHIYMHI